MAIAATSCRCDRLACWGESIAKGDAGTCLRAVGVLGAAPLRNTAFLLHEGRYTVVGCSAGSLYLFNKVTATEDTDEQVLEQPVAVAQNETCGHHTRDIRGRPSSRGPGSCSPPPFSVTRKLKEKDTDGTYI